MRRLAALLAITVTVAMAASGASAGPTPPAQPADTLSVIKDDTGPGNAEVAVLLSEATPVDLPADRVLISRDDGFADALASGSLQRGAPLLLVPPRGPIPDMVGAELDRLQPREAIVLGGPAAVDAVVVEDLLARGISVRRRAGGSRIETAIAIAEELPGATTVMLARAFGASASDESQAFADALAAGGVAARNGWPILLTQHDRLSAATRDYLTSSAVTNVQILGGTAAIGQGVEDDLRAMDLTVERVAGPSRAGTAIALAEKEGDATAADADRVVLVEGTGPDAWAGGFAAANHAAHFDAPIVLAADNGLPPETAAFLEGGADGDGSGEVRLTCVTRPFTCEQSRRALGLPAIPYLFLTPESGTLQDGGETVTVAIDPPEAGEGAVIRPEDTGRFGGGCFASLDEVPLDGGSADLVLVDTVPDDGCETTLWAEVDGVAIAVTLAGYYPGAFLPDDFGAMFAETFVVGEVAPETTVAVDIDLTCTSPDGTVATDTARVLTAVGSNGFQINSRYTGLQISRFDACEADATLPTGFVEPVWGVFSFLDTTFQDALFEGLGAHADFDLAASQRDINGFNLLFLGRLTDPRPVAPPLPRAATAPIYRLFTGVAVSCDDGTTIVPDDGGPVEVDVPHGTECLAEATDDGNVLVAQANAEPMEAPRGTQVPFTADSTLGPTMVWFLPAA